MYNPLLRGTPLEKPPPQQQKTGGGYDVNALKSYGQQVAAKYQVPWPIFNAMITHESGWSTSPSEVSSAGAQGIAQIMPGTAKSWGVDPWNPYKALEAAAKNLSQYYTQYGNNWSDALAAYNGGASPQGIAAAYRGGYPQAVLSRANVGFMTLPTQQPSNPLLRGYTPPAQAQAPPAPAATAGNPLLRGYTPPTATPTPAAAPPQQRKPLVTANMTPQQRRAFVLGMMGGQGTMPPRPSPLRTAADYWNVPLAFLESAVSDAPFQFKQLLTGKYFTDPKVGPASSAMIQHFQHGGAAEVAEHTLFSGPELLEIKNSPQTSPANKAIASYLLAHPTITAGGSLAEQFINPSNLIPFGPVVGFVAKALRRAEPFVPLLQDVREISQHGAATFGYPFQLLHQAVMKQLGRGIYFAIRKLPGPAMKAASALIDRYAGLADRGGASYVQAAFAANAAADHAAAVGDKFMDDVFGGLTPQQHQKVEALSAINPDGSMMANPNDWAHVPEPAHGPPVYERAAALRAYMKIKDARQEALQIRKRTVVQQPSVAKQVTQPGAQPTIKRGDLRDSDTYFPGGMERMPGGKPEPVYQSQVPNEEIRQGKLGQVVEIGGLEGMGGRGRGKFSVGVTKRGMKKQGPRLKPEDFPEDLHPEYLSGFQVKAHYNEVNRAIANEERLVALEQLPSINPETGEQRTGIYPGYGELPLFARMPRYHAIVDEDTREVQTFGFGKEGEAAINRYKRRAGYGRALLRARQDPLFLQVAQEAGISPQELADLIDARKLRNVRASPLKARLLEAKMTSQRAAMIERALQNRVLRLAQQEQKLQGQITAAEAMTPIPVPERGVKGKPGEPPPEEPPAGGGRGKPPPTPPPTEPAGEDADIPLLPLKPDGSYDVRNGYHSLPPEAQRALDAIPANENRAEFAPGHSSTKADEKLAMIALAKYGVKVKPTGAGELLSESRMYRPGGKLGREGRPVPVYGKRSVGSNRLWDVPLNQDEINAYDMARWTPEDRANAEAAAARFEEAKAGRIKPETQVGEQPQERLAQYLGPEREGGTAGGIRRFTGEVSVARTPNVVKGKPWAVKVGIEGEPGTVYEKRKSIAWSYHATQDEAEAAVPDLQAQVNQLAIGEPPKPAAEAVGAPPAAKSPRGKRASKLGEMPQQPVDIWHRGHLIVKNPLRPEWYVMKDGHRLYTAKSEEEAGQAIDDLLGPDYGTPGPPSQQDKLKTAMAQISYGAKEIRPGTVRWTESAGRTMKTYEIPSDDMIAWHEQFASQRDKYDAEKQLAARSNLISEWRTEDVSAAAAAELRGSQTFKPTASGVFLDWPGRPVRVTPQKIQEVGSGPGYVSAGMFEHFSGIRAQAPTFEEAKAKFIANLQRYRIPDKYKGEWAADDPAIIRARAAARKAQGLEEPSAPPEPSIGEPPPAKAPAVAEEEPASIEAFEKQLAHKGDTPEVRGAYDKVFQRIANGDKPNVQGVDPALVQAATKLADDYTWLTYPEFLDHLGIKPGAGPKRITEAEGAAATQRINKRAAQMAAGPPGKKPPTPPPPGEPPEPPPEPPAKGVPEAPEGKLSEDAAAAARSLNAQRARDLAKEGDLKWVEGATDEATRVARQEAYRQARQAEERVRKLEDQFLARVAVSKTAEAYQQAIRFHLDAALKEVDQEITALADKYAAPPHYVLESTLGTASPSQRDMVLDDSFADFIKGAGTMNFNDEREAKSFWKWMQRFNRLARLGIVLVPTVHGITNMGTHYMVDGNGNPFRMAIILNPRTTLEDLKSQLKWAPDAIERAYEHGAASETSRTAFAHEFPELLPQRLSMLPVKEQARIVGAQRGKLVGRAAALLGHGDRAYQALNDWLFKKVEQGYAIDMFDHFTKPISEGGLGMENGAAAIRVRNALGRYDNLSPRELAWGLNRTFYFYPWMKTVAAFWAKKAITDPKWWAAPVTAIRTNNELMGYDDPSKPFQMTVANMGRGKYMLWSVPLPQRIVGVMAALARLAPDIVSGRVSPSVWAKDDILPTTSWLAGHLNPFWQIAYQFGGVVQNRGDFTRVAPFSVFRQEPGQTTPSWLGSVAQRTAATFINPIERSQTLLADPVGTVAAFLIGGTMYLQKDYGRKYQEQVIRHKLDGDWAQKMHDLRLTAGFTGDDRMLNAAIQLRQSIIQRVQQQLDNPKTTPTSPVGPLTPPGGAQPATPPPAPAPIPPGGNPLLRGYTPPGP